MIVNSDPGTTTNSPWSTGYNWLINAWDWGKNTKVLWSHVDYDKDVVGQAQQPGNRAMLQTTDDASHFGNVVDSDLERAYFMAHELGHNNNGAHAEPGYPQDCPSCPWSYTEWWGHKHRSILYRGAWDHLHECWSATNAQRMATHLGTSVAGTTCN